MANHNNSLICVGRNKTKLNQMKNDLPGDVIGVCYDLTDPVNVKSIFDVCEKNSIKLDGMVYSAGMDELCPVKAFNPDNAQMVMTVNCFSFVAMCRYYYSKRISKDDSSIVAISSLGSVLNEKGMISYSMSKAALNSAVKTMSKEFLRRRIRVNAILPGGVNTKMGSEKSVVLQEVGAELPKSDIQSLGGIQPSSIARMVGYLLETNDNYFTGELIPISGGMEYNI